MGKVLTHMTMSLDGYIAQPDDVPAELFDWYGAGEVSVPSANENVAFDVDEASAEVLRELTENVGAIVSGRRLFDIADGWGDSHPAGAPVVVVTHRPPADGAERWPRTTFVDGVEAAIAKSARDRRRLRRHNCQRQRHPAGARCGPGRRGVPQPGPGGVRRGHPALRETEERAPAPRGPGRRPRPSRAAPQVSDPPLTVSHQPGRST